MQVLSGCGHAVHEDVPDKVRHSLYLGAQFLPVHMLKTTVSRIRLSFGLYLCLCQQQHTI